MAGSESRASSMRDGYRDAEPSDGVRQELEAAAGRHDPSRSVCTCHGVLTIEEAISSGIPFWGAVRQQ